MKKKESIPWYKLDNAGKLYPSIATSRVSTVYRLTVVLNIPVDPKILQLAVNVSAKNFPLFNVTLRKGIFWFYFEHTEDIPSVHKERFYPCTSLNIKGSQPMMYKIMYFNNRILIEMSHAIADGAGVIEFTKDLITNYYRVLHGEDPVYQPVNIESAEDASRIYYEKKVPVPQKVPKAYHFPFKLIDKGEYRVIDGIISYTEFKSLAASYNTSPTKMLLCLFFEAIQEYVQINNIVPNKPIILNTPVNLRGLFPSDTLRNFFISITPSIDLRLGTYSREELITYLDNYFSIYINEKNLKRYIARNVRNEEFWHVRLIPLFIKNLIIPIIYNYYGESSYTSSVSNLGTVKFDAPYGDLVERISVLPPPSEGNILKATATTYKDNMSITFGTLTDNHAIEQLLFSKIRKEGINVRIETNF